MWGEWCRVRGCWLEPQAEYQSTGHWVDQYWLIHGATLLPPTTGTSKNSSQEFITVNTFTTNKKQLNTKLSKYKFCLWLETTEKKSCSWFHCHTKRLKQNNGRSLLTSNSNLLNLMNLQRNVKVKISYIEKLCLSLYFHLSSGRTDTPRAAKSDTDTHSWWKCQSEFVKSHK